MEEHQIRLIHHVKMIRQYIAPGGKQRTIKGERLVEDTLVSSSSRNLEGKYKKIVHKLLSDGLLTKSELIRVITSVVYGLTQGTRDLQLVEMVHSMNRKGLIENERVDDVIEMLREEAKDKGLL